ncbi:hypothetical protein [Kitasatospora sp. A2-31]|uniref:hypothetical protein n=1 Tax=Kitasatospora sp. A2-31 TaxID=2916414 RepID=UPI001EEBA50F|nr:hypothetical protein [Kitasatospora sp. A2-31]MCG6496321.1 hypothetical protein [Kitasatospora sp. A2-31]
MALLAVSGAAGVLEVAVLVGFALALGTLVTLVPRSTAARRGASRPAPSPSPSPTPDSAPAPAGHGYARQR